MINNQLPLHCIGSWFKIPPLVSVAQLDSAAPS